MPQLRHPDWTQVVQVRWPIILPGLYFLSIPHKGSNIKFDVDLIYGEGKLSRAKTKGRFMLIDIRERRNIWKRLTGELNWSINLAVEGLHPLQTTFNIPVTDGYVPCKMYMKPEMSMKPDHGPSWVLSPKVHSKLENANKAKGITCETRFRWRNIHTIVDGDWTFLEQATDEEPEWREVGEYDCLQDRVYLHRDLGIEVAYAAGIWALMKHFPWSKGFKAFIKDANNLAKNGDMEASVWPLPPDDWILCQSKKFKFDYNAHLRPSNNSVQIEVQKYTAKGPSDPLFDLNVRVFPRFGTAFVLPVGACTVDCDLRVDDKEVGDNVSWTLGPKTDIRYDGYDGSLIEKAKDCVVSLFKRETPDEPTCWWQFRWRATSKDSVSQAILEMNKSNGGRNDWQKVGYHELNRDHGVCKVFLNEELEMEVAQAAGISAVVALCQGRWPFDQVRQEAERIWKERREKHREEERERNAQAEKERVLESEKKVLDAPSFPSPKSNDTMGANNVDVSCAEDEKCESR